MKDSLLNALLAPSSGRGGGILCFHQIAPDRFIRWTSRLARHYQIVSLSELVERHNQGRSLARLVALTFDDGWAKTCEPVAAVCEQEKWPITIYVMSALFAQAGTFWFAELPALIREAAGRRFGSGGHVLDLTSRGAAKVSTRSLVNRLRTLSNQDAMEVIRALRAAGRVSLPAEEPFPFVDRRFLRRYAGSDWVTFGSHSVDHRSMAAQDEEMLNWQLAESKKSIEEIIGRPVSHFCYPYGDPSAIGKLAPRVARKYYASATTMVRGVCDAARDPWYLPRIPVYDSDSNLRFLAKIALAPLV